MMFSHGRWTRKEGDRAGPPRVRDELLQSRHRLGVADALNLPHLFRNRA